MTEIPTAAGKLYLGHRARPVLPQAPGGGDRAASRRRAGLPGHPYGRPAARGGAATIAGVTFYSDRGSTYTAARFTALVP